MTNNLAVTPGAGGLPRVALTAPDGARAEVYLQGAHVTSWVPAGGDERLFLSAAANFRAGAALRGGVPVVFPQFSERGPLPKHGFARTLPWALVDVELTAATALATFQLAASEASRRVWPHAFALTLTVTLGGPCLEVALQVTNPGDTPWAFTGALHTYLRVAEVHTTVVEGLGGRRYEDFVGGGEHVQAEPALAFAGEVDRVYGAAPSRVQVRESHRTTEVAMTGFPDMVVWNPWRERGAALADLEPEGYRRMVCVEAAVANTPVAVAPGGAWQGTQTLTAR